MRLKSVTASVAVTAIALAAMTGVALAAASAAPAPAVIPYGAWLAEALKWSSFAIQGTILFLFTKYVPSLYQLFISKDTVTEAVNNALAAIENGLSGRTLTLDEANTVIEAAANWLVANEPAFAKWAGSTLKPKIVALLRGYGILPATADAKSLKYATSRAPR